MKSSTRWLVSNWKMNGDAAHVKAYAHAINSMLAMLPSSLITVYCPPTAYLSLAVQNLPKNRRLQLGAQDCHAQIKGAFTGETSAAMLTELGASYVIIGHSERRAMGESDMDIAAKARAAMAVGLAPIICVGESYEAYTARNTNAALDRQLSLLASLDGAYLIAYEPVWAIGSGKTPSLIEIEAAHRHIKSVLGSKTSVLYGGSVNAENAKEILRLPQVSGALIGSASLEIASMRDIISAACAE